MSNSRYNDLADAIVTEINSGSFSLSFTAVKRFLPLYKLEELQVLRVTVLVGNVARERATRSSTAETVTITVGIQQRVDNPDADGATLLQLATEINDYLQDKDFGNAIFLESGFRVVYDPASIDTTRVFTSVLTLTYRCTT